jgi:hypothetical protein
MTNHGLVMAFVVGGAVIAGWVHFRRAGKMPESDRRVALHAFAALIATGAVPLMMREAGTQDSVPVAMVLLFVLVLPMFVYNFVTWIWLLKLLQRRIG